MIKLPPYQNSVIVGLILSYAWLRFAYKRSTNVLLGYKHKQESKLKMSISKKGFKHTELTKAKISKNMVHTEESKKKIKKL
jgi:hypothetical protein